MEPERPRDLTMHFGRLSPFLWYTALVKMTSAGKVGGKKKEMGCQGLGIFSS